MKITFVSPHSLRNFGGGERWHITVGNMLADKEIDVEMYAMSYMPIPVQRLSLSEINKMIKFNYHEIPYIAGRYNPRRMKEVPNLVSDVFYITGGYYFFLRQCLQFKGPKVYGFHDPALQTPNSFLQGRIIKGLFPKFDMFHILNTLQETLIPAYAKRFLLENTFFEPIPDFREKFKKFTVFFFGRHEKSKGIDTLEYVIQNLNEDIELYIAGSGSVKIDIPSGKKNIHLLGFVDELTLRDYLSRSHVVLFPSYSEASPGVVTETLANSTPLVFRNIPQNRILINTELNIKCDTDSDFLDALLKLKVEYDSDPKLYLDKCRKLSQKLMSPEKYITIFIDNIRSIVE